MKLFIALCAFPLIVFQSMLPVESIAQESWMKQFSWREIGPTATGGRVVDIDVNPNNEHHILVASAAGGLWETKNNGTTWACIFENEGTTTIGDITFDPKNPDTIWIGTGEANNQRSSLWGDGIYKSTDAGKTWKNMGLPESHHIGRVVVDPTDSNTVYVAVLGHLYTANPERGLYKTSDGGKNWKQVLNINPDVGVVDVVLDPKNPKTVFAASYERRRRAWDFDGAGPGSGIYKSTDAGESWTKLSAGLPTGNIGRIGIDIFPKDPQIIYATVSNQNPAPPEVAQERRGPGERTGDQAAPANPSSRQQAMAFFGIPETEPDEVPTILGVTLDFSKSDVVTVKGIRAGSTAQRQGMRDGDQLISAGGVAAANEKQVRAFFTALKPGDQVALVIMQDNAERTVELAASTTPPPREIGGEIYRSSDGGTSWEKMNKTPAGGSPDYYYGQIRVDPQDDQRLYVLGVPVSVSTDGGKTFKNDGAPSVHVDHHAFWINPKNPNHLMLGNDGGFHISYDQAGKWDYVFNLPLAQFYAIAVDMQHPYHVYGGLQDNGSWGGPSKSGGSGVGRADWYRVNGGDGFYVQVDPNDHNLVISESQFGAIARLDRSTGRPVSIRPPQAPGVPDRYNWNSPILMSTHDPRVVYFGGNKLFKSFNRGDDWLTISPDLTTNDASKISGNVPHCTITTIAESRLDKNLLMAGTDDGKVHVTVDGGESWKDVSSKFPYRPNSWWCSRVEFSHADKHTAYVSFTGYREDDFRPFVFKTTDAGDHWTSIAANLPAEPINVIKQDPSNPKTLYVGTEFAVFVSLNDGELWYELGEGLPRVSVQDLLVHPRDNDLVIGTHGRGMYVLDQIKPLQDFKPEVLQKPAHLFSVDDWTPISRDFSGGGFAGDRQRLAPNPPNGTAIWYHLKDDTEQDAVSLTVLDLTGKEVSKLEVDNKAGLHKVAFPPTGGGGSGEGGRGRFQRGPSIPPGRYKAVLKFKDQTEESIFEIKTAGS